MKTATSAGNYSRVAWNHSRHCYLSSTPVGAPCTTCATSQHTWLPTELAGTTTPPTSPSCCSWPPLTQTPSSPPLPCAGRTTWMDTRQSTTEGRKESCLGWSLDKGKRNQGAENMCRGYLVEEVKQWVCSSVCMYRFHSLVLINVKRCIRKLSLRFENEGLSKWKLRDILYFDGFSSYNPSSVFHGAIFFLDT